MPTVKEIVEELDFYSSNLSSNVRTVALGAIAFSWALVVDSKASIYQVAPALILALLAVFFDFLQYYASYYMNTNLLKKMEKEDLKEVSYNNRSFLYRFKQSMFHLKLILTILSCLYILGITFHVATKTT